ncbi:MAG: GerAB/ArcD/ProY family transporter [Bacilli bacterium]
MKENQINIYEYRNLSFLIICSFLTTSIMSFFVETTLNKTCLSLIIASIIGFIPIKLFLNIQNKYKDMNIMEINNHVFGNFLGKTINVITILVVSLLLGYLTYEFSFFINYEFLQNTPVLFINFIIIVLCTFILKYGIEGFFRGSSLLIFLTLLIIGITYLFLITKVDLPILLKETSVTNDNIFKTIFIFLTLCILPNFTMLIIRQKEVKFYEEKKIFRSYIYANIFFILTMFLISTIITYKYTFMADYPIVMLLSKISAFRIFGRIDNLISLIYIVFIVLTIIYVLYFVYKGSLNFFKKESSLVLIPAGILAFGSSSLFTFDKIYNILIKYYYYPFILVFLIIPIIIYLKQEKSVQY